MNMREIETGFSVAPQLGAGDFAMLAELGVKTIINNRSDEERGIALTSGEAREIAAGHGIDYHYIPVAHNGLSMEALTEFANVLQRSPRPIIAHCASGQRSAMVWALASAGTKSVDEIISSCAAQGFNVAPMRPILMQLAQQAA